MREQTIQPRFVSGPAWICLRQMRSFRALGRSPLRGKSAPYGGEWRADCPRYRRRRAAIDRPCGGGRTAGDGRRDGRPVPYGEGRRSGCPRCKSVVPIINRPGPADCRRYRRGTWRTLCAAAPLSLLTPYVVLGGGRRPGSGRPTAKTAGRETRPLRRGRRGTDAVGALIKRPRMRCRVRLLSAARRMSRPVCGANNRLREQTIQPRFVSGPAWICLRQMRSFRAPGAQ